MNHTLPDQTSFDSGAWMRRFVSAAAANVPARIRHFLIGSPASPSRFAGGVHEFLNRLPGARIICLPCSGRLQGYRMKIDWSRHRSYIHGAWEQTVTDVLAQVVKPGMCAVDVGAHIGFYTLLLSNLVGTDGRVVAFEPLPWNFSVLSENILMNNCLHVEALNRAVLDRSCELSASEFDDGDPLPGTVSLSDSESNGSIYVKATSLDDFFADHKYRVHFMKVDVEGAESLVLKGATQTIESDHPTMVMKFITPTLLLTAAL
jgi:FkbM family methyltransferase